MIRTLKPREAKRINIDCVRYILAGLLRHRQHLDPRPIPERSRASFSNRHFKMICKSTLSLNDGESRRELQMVLACQTSTDQPGR
ncbi:MAG: hypothetical protein ACK5Q5_16435 [Planctomycetaceae bacterium]